MSDEEGKVDIEVLRPGNPLAPAPHQAAAPRSEDIDRLLQKLPEWQEELGPALAAAQAAAASPVAVRVGIAKPRSEKKPIQRSRVIRSTRVALNTPPPPVDDSAPPVERSPAESSPTKTQATSNKAKPLARSPQERIRNLSLAEQQKVARTGELSDRVALERLYGKSVWESLLHNVKLTPPEVLRIARMVSLPVPLLDIIVNHRSWLNAPQVRRALLANRRLTADMIGTVLRATPKNELKLMQKQTAYPSRVREAAAKLYG